MAEHAAISIRDLTVRYPGAPAPALRGVSVEIEGGAVVGVIGLTGAGKSTLLRSLNGIVPHLVSATMGGTLMVAGLDPVAGPVALLSSRVGMVLDDPDGQTSQSTVAEEVALGLESRGLPSDLMEARVAETLVQVGLGGLRDRAPMTLSGGELQRLAIACAIAVRPAVLVMDEPTGNLDPAGRAAVFELVHRLNRNDGLTVVIADHDIERLADRADRILVLHEGRLVADGPPEAVLGRPAELDAPGIGLPQVTELAAAVGGAGTRRPEGQLPVTLDGAVAWLVGRG